MVRFYARLTTFVLQPRHGELRSRYTGHEDMVSGGGLPRACLLIESIGGANGTPSEAEFSRMYPFGR